MDSGHYTPGVGRMRRAAILIAMVMIIGSVLYIDPGPRVEGGSPTRAVIFTDVALSSFDQTSAPTFISAVDWNNDGYTDLLFNGNKLHKNNGPPDWDFSIQGSVFDGSISGARNGVWADWDGDGDQDLYQGCSKGTADRFWENQGAPDFGLEDVSSTVFGSWQNTHPNTGNAWGDLDRDGDLDLYVGNGEDWNDGNPIYYQDYILRNDGGTGFTDISAAAGITTGENFYSRGVTWGDYNNDHWQDAYVSHYRIRENHLFENQMDGTFEEVGQEKNCSGTYSNDWYYDATAGSVYGQSWWGPNWGHTIGSSWADFNRDGNLDLWTSDFVHKYVGYIGDWYDIRGYVCDDANLYINDGAPYYTFTDYRNTSGIPKWPIGGSGTYQGDQTFAGITIGDYDNDGWEDMYIPQVYGDLPYTTPHLFHNLGVVQDGSVPDGTTFEDATDSLGIKGANTYANLWVDYDNDGDLDLVTGGADTWNGGDRKWENYRVRLYQNSGSPPNKWLKIELQGNGKNPQAIGSKVMLRYEINGEEKIITREVRSGTGQAHQDSNILHFGMGWDPIDSTYKNARLEVHWPDGVVSEYSKIDGNSISYDRKHILMQPEISNSLDTTVVLSSDPVLEGDGLNISVTATHPNLEIEKYGWDIDSDNHMDFYTDDGNVKISYFLGEGLFHVRCRAYYHYQPLQANHGSDIYPIEFNVLNKPPVINIFDVDMNMDEELNLTDIIDDNYLDMKEMSWSIDWGDGSFDVGGGQINNSHIYTEPGDFELEVTADDGTDIVTSSRVIKVNNILPWGWVEPDIGNESAYMEDETAYMIPVVFDSPSDDIRKRTYRWDFGDGTIEMDWHSWENGVHRYERAGQYSVVAYVKDQYGYVGILNGTVRITNPSPMIEYNDEDEKYQRISEDVELEIPSREFIYSDTVSDQDSLKFQWDYGDDELGVWSASPEFKHAYTKLGMYTAFCTVKDDDNATDILSLNIEVDNTAPSIKDTTFKEEAFEDDLIEIKIEGMDSISDMSSLKYEIEFSDGKILISDNGTFQFTISDEGYYDITTRVYDNDLAKDEKTIMIHVFNKPPTGDIYIETNSYDEDQIIVLRAENIWDTSSDLPFIRLLWDMGDGSFEHGPNVTHVYTKKGRYNVRMYIEDDSEDNERTMVQKNININNPTPVASFSTSGGMIDHTRSVQSMISFFANDSTDNPSDMDSLLYLWDFGDGEEDEGMSITHEFKTSGIYTVTLQVMDDDGAIGEDSMDLEIILDDDTPVGEKNSPNTALIIAVLGVGLVLILVLLLGGILLLRKRQESQQQFPPPQRMRSLPHQGSTQQNVAQIPPKPPVSHLQVAPPSPPQPPSLPPRSP